MPRAIIYCRVSTQEQAESGAGIQGQEDACRSHAARAGLDVVGPFVDEGISGAAPLDSRPGMLDAVAQLLPDDILLVAKRDRLARDPFVLAVIEVAVTSRRARIVSVAGQGTESDEPESILMRRMVDAFAEFERLLGKSRTRSALAAKKRRNQRTGSIPFGFDLADDGLRSKKDLPIALVPNSTEQATIALVGDLHRDGWPLRRIARELDRRGVPTKKGGASWSPGSVSRILERPPTPAGGPPDHAATP